MFDHSSWESLLKYHSAIKQIYIQCEETDPELKTNLQPLNEFRMALDHTYRLIENEIENQNNDVAETEFAALSSHLRRVFFDVCDMLAINYRNKIISSLTPFSPEAIKEAIPQYYQEYRPRIEEISSNIQRYRNDKGNLEIEDKCVQEYKADVLALKDMFVDIHYKIPAIKEINYSQRRKKFSSYVIPGIIGLLAGILLKILFE